MLCKTEQSGEQNERKTGCRAAARGTDLCLGSKTLIGKSDLKRQRQGRREKGWKRWDWNRAREKQEGNILWNGLGWREAFEAEAWGRGRALKDTAAEHAGARSSRWTFRSRLPVLERALGMLPPGSSPAGRRTRCSSAGWCWPDVLHRHAVTQQL